MDCLAYINFEAISLSILISIFVKSSFIDINIFKIILSIFCRKHVIDISKKNIIDISNGAGGGGGYLPLVGKARGAAAEGQCGHSSQSGPSPA